MMPRQDADDRDRKQRDQRQAPVHDHSRHDHADHLQHVDDQEGQAEGEEILHPAGILSKPGDDGAHGMAVVIAHGQPLQAVVELRADVEAGAGPQPGADAAADDAQTGSHRRGPDERHDQPEEGLRVARDEHVIREELREVGRDHQQYRPSQHQHAHQGHLPAIGMGIPQQTPQGGAPAQAARADAGQFAQEQPAGGAAMDLVGDLRHRLVLHRGFELLAESAHRPGQGAGIRGQVNLAAPLQDGLQHPAADEVVNGDLGHLAHGEVDVHLRLPAIGREHQEPFPGQGHAPLPESSIGRDIGGQGQPHFPAWCVPGEGLQIQSGISRSSAMISLPLRMGPAQRATAEGRPYTRTGPT